VAADRHGGNAAIPIAGLGLAAAALLCLFHGCAAGVRRSADGAVAGACIGASGRIEAEANDRHDGSYVGDIEAGERLTHAFCVQSEGVYRVMFWVTSVTEVGAFRVEFDAGHESEPLVIPRTRHGGTWIPLWLNVELDAGEHSVRLVALKGGFRLDAIEVVRENVRINVRDHGAVGDGVTDDSPAVLEAQKRAYAMGAQLFFPSGSYRIRSVDHPALVRMFPVRVGWIGEDRQSTTIIYESTGIHSRGLSAVPEPGPINPQRLATRATSPRALLVQQAAGRREVTVAAARQAEQFSSGDAVFLAVGKNPYDADDAGLFRYVGIYDVEQVDPATGEITLDRIIPVPLTVEAPFDGTAGDVPDYAIGASYEKGDIAFHDHSFYRALNAGVAHAAPSASRTQGATGQGAQAASSVAGVAWRRLTNNICCPPDGSDGMSKAGQDYRPFLQKIEGLRPFLSLQDLTVRAAGSEPHIMAVDFRGVQNGLIDDVEVIGNAAVAIGASVSANVRINRVKVDLDPASVGGVGHRAVGGWAAEHTVISNSFLRGGRRNPHSGNYDAALFLEGSADYTLYKTRIEPHVEEAPDATFSYGVMLDNASVSIVDCDVGPFDAALRWNVALAGRGIDPDALSPYYSLNELQNNTFRVSARQLRLFGHDNPRVWNASNRYILHDLFRADGIDYPKTITFAPEKIVEITTSFVPQADQRPANLDLERWLEIDGERVDTHLHAFVVLKVSAEWPEATPGGIEIRVGAKGVGSSRGFRSRDMDSTRSLHLSDVSRSASDLDGDGAAVLYVEPARETLRISYHSGALGTEPGRVTVKIQALMGLRQ
jgi:hypothetical protein